MFSLHPLPCPVWFTPENLQVPPATVAVAASPGLPEASEETRSRRTQQDILPLPLTQTPLPLPECTVSLPLPLIPPPTPTPPPLGCKHCLYCTEKGRVAGTRRGGWRGEGKLGANPPAPASASQSSLPSRKGKGVVFAWELFSLPLASCPLWSRCFWVSQPLICTPENHRIEFR